MIDWPPALYIVMGAAALLSLWLWVYGIGRMLRRGRLLEPEERRAVPWALVDLALVLLIFALLSLVATAVITRIVGPADGKAFAELRPRQATVVLWVHALSNLLSAGLALLLVRLRAQARRPDIGWAPEKFWQDVALGGVAFVMLAPPVYAVQAILTQWIGLESVHPLIELLKKETTAGLVIAASFSAVIVAPLVEEVLFRLLLQGWFERAALSARWHAGLIVPDATAPEVAQVQTPERLRGQRAWWPIFGSSLIFAAMHAGHGSDPLPLFLLGLGLGYLYQRTHRLVPCIVVHVLLNGCTMLMLFWQLMA